MLNGSYGFRAPSQLIVPKGTEGWKTLGTIYNGVAGYMSWKDKQKQAERINEAQDKYYDALTKYLNGERQSEPEKPVEVEIAEQEEVFDPFANNRPNKLINRMDEIINSKDYQKAPNVYSLLGNLGG